MFSISKIGAFIMGKIGGQAKGFKERWPSYRFWIVGVALNNGAPVDEPEGQPASFKTCMSTEPDTLSLPKFFRPKIVDLFVLDRRRLINFLYFFNCS